MPEAPPVAGPSAEATGSPARPTQQPSRARLDAELVRRGLARARGQADELIRAGRVHVDGRPATKGSLHVTDSTTLTVDPGDRPSYVGRGALKLADLLDELAVTLGDAPLVMGRRCLDAGASTGGFTQVLLERGATTVVAVDVGQGQLAQLLVDDDRVIDRSGTTVRGLRPEEIGGQVDLLVADLSFISVSVVLGDLVGLVRRGGDLVVLVKPQFEVGRERLGSGGVVRDAARRVEAVVSVARAAADVHGLAVRAVRASRWPGPSGNVEYFLWLSRPGPGEQLPAVPTSDLAGVVELAVREGPTA